MKNDKIVRVIVVDTEPFSGGENCECIGSCPILQTYYLKNPDMEKLEKLKFHIQRRYQFLEDFGEGFETIDDIDEYVKENFEEISIEDYSIDW